MLQNKIYLVVLSFWLVASAFAQNKGISPLPPLDNRVLVQNLRSINTPYLEFSPTYYREGIVFVTSRQRGGLYDPQLNTTYFELFHANLNKEGIPYKPRPFSLEINSKYHEGPVSFSGDASQMFFSRNDILPEKKKNKKTGVAKNQLFSAQRGMYDWENIQALPFNDPAYNFMHPALHPDGSKLYFVSDRPGGFGGYDIYVADNIDGQWMDPINLGPEINTPGNEVFPFFHPTGVLFFASNGHSGFGGLDLFLIDVSQRIWGELINMGPPFNSPEDDFGLSVNTTGTQGFFSSNREGGEGKDDLYIFNAPEGLEGVKVAQQIMARISVRDADNGKLLEGTQIRVFEKAPDGSARHRDLYEVEIQPASSTSGNGFAIVERRRAATTLEAPAAVVGPTGYAILNLDPGTSYLLFLEREGYLSQEIDVEVTPAQSFYPLEVMMEKKNCITLRGRLRSQQYNQAIPNATVRIASNCNEQVAVLRSGPDGNYEYCLEPNCRYLITTSKVGFADQSQEFSTERLGSSRSFTINFSMPPAQIPVEDQRDLLQKGTIIYLEGITYDFNKSAIRKGAARDLDALAKLLQRYPDLQIEVGAHTDSRGSSDYNLALSQTRALYAQDYLIEQGVAPHRISSKGYGETQLRNECGDGVTCTEQQHAYNRRLEIKVLQINQIIDMESFNEILKQ